MELKPCPWCNGRAGIVSRQMQFLGQNYYGNKKIRYAANGKCYKCHARGPVVTAVIITDKRETNSELDALYRRAEDAWNRREVLTDE